MSANLPYEIGKFQEHTKFLKQIKRDTNRYFRDIQQSGHLDRDILSAFLPEDDKQSLSRVCEKPATIIVVGQTCYAKVCIINELLGEPVLPAVEELDCQTSWRMIHIKYGSISNVSLVLPGSFELAAPLNAYEGSWECVPRGDLELKINQKSDPALATAVAEVSLNHALLKAGAEIVCSPSNNEGDVKNIFQACCEDVLPIVLYAIEHDTLTEEDKSELVQVKALVPDLAIFFVKCNKQKPQLSNSLTEYARDEVVSEFAEVQTRIFEQLCEVGFLSPDLKEDITEQQTNDDKTAQEILESVKPKSNLIEDFSLFPCFLLFVRQVLQYHLVSATTVLNNAHEQVLAMFITTAFDMARDMIITPRRIEYAREREEELFEALMDSANRKQDEIRDVIHDTITSLQPKILSEVEKLQFNNVELTDEEELVRPKDLESCTIAIQDLVMNRINMSVAKKMISSVEHLKDSYIGTLKRCLESLEKCDKEAGSEGGATVALSQVLDAAYQVQVTVRASSSLARLLWEKMKQTLQNLPGKAPPRVDTSWKQKVASDMLATLSETRLAKNICSQFKMRLLRSHDAFSTHLRLLEAHHSGRLERTEEQRMRVRKNYAPKIARLALESTSLRDVVLYGMPQLGREVGRGQYGVVYACDRWAGHHPCAIKSVVPPDDKHWNDLALEFYYTGALPKHDRVVSLIGSVIDYSYAGGSSPAVLLVMDRLQRDLYQGIKAGLSFRSRMQVAVDVIEGIRFLHSQGLVHRDIKLKNVLLDNKNRGKITDLGFCKPEAMMSGSIVGTPIHMAPELFSGHYDNSVDVYAFGILFWYICAGTVRLPLAFEQCASKDHLWNSVRKGVRPERLSNFDEDCWTLMERCWDGNPYERPLPGHIYPKLIEIHKRAESRCSSSKGHRSRHEGRSVVCRDTK